MYIRASQVLLVVKNLPANAGDIKDVGSTEHQTYKSIHTQPSFLT